ncbi:hypothetical protein [Thiomicrospira microaerophila]|uniref:hypothetical protein n=1 Tax=Thiomicrospira microaerophila TaxID=406020 RepID=UPI0005CA6385|nr:hypothetical protein [Thiomicrospira microaerophila]
MVYITNGNLKNILSKFNTSVDNNADYSRLYEQPLNKILSGKELSALAAYKSFCENPQDALNYYKRIDMSYAKTSRLVFEGSQKPAYHCDIGCERLNSDYYNIEIPNEIVHKGSEEVERYRAFAKEHASLLRTDPNAFLLKQDAHFFLKNPPKEIQGANSGVHEFENYDLPIIKNAISQLLEDAEKFRHQTTETKKIIAAYGYGTHRHLDVLNGIKDSTIYIWHHTYKNELKTLLQRYFRVKLNKHLSFEGSLLKQLGFRRCSCCT